MRTILRIVEVATVAASLLPAVARAHQPAQADEREVLAETLFMYDALPAGGRELNLIFGLEEEADPATGEKRFLSVPEVELATALGPRLSLSAKVGISTDGSGMLEAPGASLRYYLLRPGAQTLGLAASFDVVGSTHAASDSEVGVGLGAIRAVGPLALRATVSGATAVSSWSPRLEGGFSAAIALGSRWCALAEIVTEATDGGITFAAGPTLKAQIGEHLAIKGGALFPLAPDVGTPAFAIQLTRYM